MIVTDINGKVILSNGIAMPYLGLGMYQLNDFEELKKVLTFGLDCGYRLIDTATAYKNEEEIGRIISEYDLGREELFITTKVSNNDQGYENTLKAFDKSLQKLKTKYVDLYLIHWPVKEMISETWKALEKLYESEYVKAIGVSNFGIDQLEILFNDANIIPMINQIEFHPLLTQNKLREFCNLNKIQVEAYSPLIMGNLSRADLITNIANKYNKTTAQIILRWDLQKNIISIPKSKTLERIKENTELFDFIISEDDVLQIDSLNCNCRFGSPPEKHM